MQHMNDYDGTQLHQPCYEGHGVEDFNLVLEGGAMRGQFTAGVIDYFCDNKLFAAHTIGTSAGALVGSTYVAGEDGRTCYLNCKYCTDPMYMSLRSFAKTGNAFNRELSFDRIPHELDPLNYEAFRNSPMKLTSVSSDLVLGEADYHTYSDLDKEVDYLIATSSMPLVSKIVEVDDKLLLDGGTCDSVPLGYSLMTGTKKHVVVLTQDATYIKKPNKLAALAQVRYGEYPYFLDRITERHFEYNRVYRACVRLHEQGRIFLIRPAMPVTVAQMETDPVKLFDLYEQGYAQAARQWNDLLKYLEL